MANIFDGLKILTLIDEHSIDVGRLIVTVAIPAISGLAGVAIGSWLTSLREQKQRKLAFLEKQLSMFYSPMLGLRNEVKVLGSIRARVQAEANTVWEALCSSVGDHNFEAGQRLPKERGPEFERIVKYDNAKLHGELMPAYKKMAEIFRENYWLAEPETRSYYVELIEFVEIWNRWLDQSLPVEVLKRLDHGESNLAAFYEQVEQTHDGIRQKLKSGLA